jgi:predicted RNA-binding protein YlqC (UPF0109 family)
MKYAPLVEFCVAKLVDEPDAISVEEVSDGDAIQVQVRVAPDDTGKVIGRSGRLVTALRQIVSLAASKSNKNVYVKVVTE